jgi:hypothetical protein
LNEEEVEWSPFQLEAATRAVLSLRRQRSRNSRSSRTARSQRRQRQRQGRLGFDRLRDHGLGRDEVGSLREFFSGQVTAFAASRGPHFSERMVDLEATSVATEAAAATAAAAAAAVPSNANGGGRRVYEVLESPRDMRARHEEAWILAQQVVGCEAVFVGCVHALAEWASVVCVCGGGG